MSGGAGPSVAQRRIILVGAGHAHLEVLQRLDALRSAGAHVQLVDPGDFWYSGMATRMLAGGVPPAADRIDISALADGVGVERVRAAATTFSPAPDGTGGSLTLDDGRVMDWDILSLNVGSVVPLGKVPGASDHAVPVKPIAGLAGLRRGLEGGWRTDGGGPARIVVVGAGPSGCEVASSLHALAERTGTRVDIVIVTRSACVLPNAPVGAQRAMRRALTHRKIELRPNTAVRSIESGAVHTSEGSLRADLVIGANGLVPPAWLAKSGLPVASDGGLRVDATLRSIGCDRVFAVGDCAQLEGHALPRLGVFGVRQAPVLVDNLVAACTGHPPSGYEPQERWLSILHLGEGDALATWGPFWWRGRLASWVKNWIDGRWMDRMRAPIDGGPPDDARIGGGGSGDG